MLGLFKNLKMLYILHLLSEKNFILGHFKTESVPGS